MRQEHDCAGVLRDLERRSFAVVQLADDGVHRHLASVAALLDGATHDTYDDALEFGRLRLPYKEFMAIKLGLPLATLWPTPQLKAAGHELFLEHDKRARRMFCGLGICDGKKLLQEQPLQVGEISSSFLHMFRYFGQSNVGEPCSPHTDSGLITVIPRALGEPALQCFDGSRFVSVEDLFPEQLRVATVLAGETLAALSNGRVRATVHRVVATKGQRVSVPFQLRADMYAPALQRLIIA